MSIATIYVGDGSNPVNSLGAATRSKLFREIMQALVDDTIGAIVLTGYGGRVFSAGADITEFGKEEAPAVRRTSISSKEEEEESSTPIIVSLVDLCNLLERSEKPVLCSISGFALGGGLELALSCDYRIMSQSAKVALPETHIGLIPGAGGTQRLPRLTNVQFALDMICSGRHIGSEEASSYGLVDEVTSDNELKERTHKWAEWIALLKTNSHRKLLNKTIFSEENVDFCNKFLQKLQPADLGGEAVRAAVQAIKAAVAAKTYVEGHQVEKELFLNLLKHSAQGRALRYAFFNDTSTKKVRPVAIPKNSSVGTETVGVVGAGTMGSGIAISFLKAGYPHVLLLDVNKAGLERGVGFIKKAIANDVRKGRLSQKEGHQILSRLHPTLSFQDFNKCNVVVEAVFEKLELKQNVFKQLDMVISDPKALILTNTSTLDVNKIAESLSPNRRRNSLGMHFFSPAHIMKLVEIVKGNYTSQECVDWVKMHTKKILKVGVVVNNCDGFVGNRMLNPYTSEMLHVLEEGGCDVSTIDRAILKFGMKLGPFQMSDLAGNDIGYLIKKERGVKEGARDSKLNDILVEKYKRLGQKVGKGWYDYNKEIGGGRKPLPSREVSELVASVRRSNGLKISPLKTPQEIVERILYPLLNEGFKILEEGIAIKPSDIDIIYLYGYGWPRWRGGPMFYADEEVGLSHLLKTLEDLSQKYPGSGYYKPSQLLRKCVESGMKVSEFYARKAKYNNTQSKL